MPASAFRPPLVHRLWRRLPVRQRRSLVTWGSALLAPRSIRCRRRPAMASRSPASSRAPPASARARACSHAASSRPACRTGRSTSATCCRPTPRTCSVASEQPPQGAPLILHVNAPLLPRVLFRLPRDAGARPPDHRLLALGIADGAAGLAGRRAFRARGLGALRLRRRRGGTAAAGARQNRAIPAGRRQTSSRPRSTARHSACRRARSWCWSRSTSPPRFERKNPLAAITAFRAAFGDRADRILLLKVGNREHAPDDFARIVAAVGGAPNIRLETRTLPSADLHALTAASDIVMSLHRSEGFGLVLAEAMLLRKPVIATGWSGNMAFMDADSAALVDYRLVATRRPAAGLHRCVMGGSGSGVGGAASAAPGRRCGCAGGARRERAGRRNGTPGHRPARHGAARHRPAPAVDRALSRPRARANRPAHPPASAATVSLGAQSSSLPRPPRIATCAERSRDHADGQHR